MTKHEPKLTPERTEALSSGAASGCTKCAHELETGIRPRKAHDEGCPFKKSPEKKTKATVNNDQVAAMRKTSEVVEDSNEEEDEQVPEAPKVSKDPKRSMFDKWGDKFRDFLDNAE